MKRQLLKQGLSIFMSVMLLSQSLIANVPQSREDAQANLLSYLESQQEVYKKNFDKELLLDELDYDVDNIIHFMRKQIVYQAYDGILRGVKGTLIGRAGNASDQALTLASMLNDADVEAQIMVTELNDMQIKELNQQITSANLPSLAPIDRSKLPNILKQLVEKTERIKSDSQSVLKKVYKENERIAENIYNHISPKDLKEGTIAFAKELHDSTKTYRWVRYRTSTDASWIEVHPAYTDAKNWELTANIIEAGTVNAQDLQKLSMQVWIKTSDGKKRSVTGKWTAPAANLLDRPLSIEISSNAMFKPELLGNTKEFLNASEYFFVKINDTLPKEGKVFDLSGNVYSADSIEGLNSVFATVGKKMNEVSSMFSKTLNFTTNTEKKSQHISKVWIEFEVEKSATNSEITSRIIFEGNSLSNSEYTAMNLLQRWDIHIHTTKAMPAYHQTIKSEQIFSTLNGLNTLQKHTHNKAPKKQDILVAASSLLPNQNIVRLTQINALFDTFKDDKNTISYSKGINILAIRQGISKGDEGFRLYQISDIVSNKRNSFNNKLQRLPLLSIKHGIWETLSEQSKVMEHKNLVYQNSAYDSLADTPSLQVTQTNQNSISISMYGDNKTWWEVDRLSGSTIGMMSLTQGNAGAEMAEYIGLTISVAFTIIGTLACAYGTSADTTCCIGVNGNIMLMGLMAGFILATLLVLAIPAITTAALVTTTVGVGVVVDLAGAAIPNVENFCSGGSMFPTKKELRERANANK